jgi:hypothetical protein
MDKRVEPQIAILSLECQRALEVLLDKTSEGNGPGSWSNTAVEEELSRFKIWASNIGAMRTGKASLDYRLRRAEYLTESVKSLLEDLNESLCGGSIVPLCLFLT